MALYRKGMSGPEIEEIQEFLVANGYDLPKYGVDGKWGSETDAAVRAFQADQGLVVDGIWGPKTQAAADSFSSDAGTVTTDTGGTGTSTTSTDQGGGVTTGTGTVDESPATSGVGGVNDATVSILTGAEMEWHFDASTGKWYVSYGLPNSDRKVLFEATGEQLDAIFGAGQRPVNYSVTTFNDLVADENTTFAGDISEVEGTGSFEGEIDRVVALALDEGVLPDWAKNDPAVMDLLFIAHSEGKSQEWLIEQIAKLPSFKERFPGLENLTSLGLSVTEAVTGFLEFEYGIKQLVLQDGGDPSTVTPQLIGDMMDQGQSLDDAEFVFKIFDTMEKNAGALEAFNQVLAAKGMDPLGEDDWFEFLAGNAPNDLYDIWEQSSLVRAATDAGLNLSVEQGIELAKKTEGLTSYDSALEGLTLAASNLLRFRSQIELGNFGLNEQDLIDLSLGLAPSSGTPQADIARNIQRAVGAAAATRDRARSNPFKRFTNEGVPQEASLSNLRQEG